MVAAPARRKAIPPASRSSPSTRPPRWPRREKGSGTASGAWSNADAWARLVRDRAVDDALRDDEVEGDRDGRSGEGGDERDAEPPRRGQPALGPSGRERRGGVGHRGRAHGGRSRCPRSSRRARPPRHPGRRARGRRSGRRRRGTPSRGAGRTPPRDGAGEADGGGAHVSLLSSGGGGRAWSCPGGSAAISRARASTAAGSITPRSSSNRESARSQCS